MYMGNGEVRISCFAARAELILVLGFGRSEASGMSRICFRNKSPK